MAADDGSLDFTDHRQAEEAVGESQELLRLVLATLPVGVSVIDRSGDVVLSNSQLRTSRPVGNEGARTDTGRKYRSRFGAGARDAHSHFISRRPVSSGGS